MADWSILEREWSLDPTYDSYSYGVNKYYQEKEPLSQFFMPQAQAYISSSPTRTLLKDSCQNESPTPRAPTYDYAVLPRGETPREARNKAEKQRRDKLNQSISELAMKVPPVVAANRKVDKTGVLRLTAHFLRAHQYVFGDSIHKSKQEFRPECAQAVLGFFQGFLLTTTYKGIVVVVSQNVQQYLGYSEMELLGHNVLSIIHKDDHQILKDHLMPQNYLLGRNGELLIPNIPDGHRKVAEALSSETKRFVVRFKKLTTQRSGPCQYVTCYVEGSLRKSDRGGQGYNRCCQMVRRGRTRCDNTCSSGNDVVFVGVVRPTSETFMSESNMESFRMEYRTRHSIDGEIIQCEQRIALVTGYMTHEVNGLNAMNFMHRDDVRWVIVALREMYDQRRMVGESCYRLMTKNGDFIYMRTRGCLDVDSDSRAVRTFVCTNTVVGEQEGKHLIKMMKKKFMLLVGNSEDLPLEEESEDVTDSQSIPVEDPRQLEKVILHLVTNLPSPLPEDYPSVSSELGATSAALPIAIIPPKKERIIQAIEKIYNIIKSIREPSKMERDYEYNQDATNNTPVTSTITAPATSTSSTPSSYFQASPFALPAPLPPVTGYFEGMPVFSPPLQASLLALQAPQPPVASYYSAVQPPINFAAPIERIGSPPNMARATTATSGRSKSKNKLPAKRRQNNAPQKASGNIIKPPNKPRESKANPQLGNRQTPSASVPIGSNMDNTTNWISNGSVPEMPSQIINPYIEPVPSTSGLKRRNDDNVPIDYTKKKAPETVTSEASQASTPSPLLDENLLGDLNSEEYDLTLDANLSSITSKSLDDLLFFKSATFFDPLYCNWDLMDLHNEEKRERNRRQNGEE